MKSPAFLLATLCVAQCATAQTYSVQTEVYFENIEKTIISEIAQAKESIHVQIFKFNSKPIALALIEAKKRGLDVAVIIDGKEARNARNRAKMLSESGISTLVDAKHSTMHNKVMIIDRDRVITGSFNYTKKADRKNAENILVLCGSKLRDRYLENWNRHQEHSLSFSDYAKTIGAK